MDDAAAPKPTGFRRWWPISITVVVILWLATMVFLLMHTVWPRLHYLPESSWEPIEIALFWAFPIFVVNLYFQFRWSGLTPRMFARKRWLDILMVVPVFRGLMFLRLFRLGSLGFVVRIVNGIRGGVKGIHSGRKTAKKASKIVKAKTMADEAGAEPSVGGEKRI